MASSEDVLISIIDRIKKNPDFRKRFLEALGLDDYVRRRDISEILEEIRNIRLDMKKMFEENSRKFEDLLLTIKEDNKKFEKIFQKLDENDKRFEETYKRFDRIDSNFDKLFQKFDELFFALGYDFETFDSLWLQNMLREDGFPRLKIKKRTFFDESNEVFPDSKEFEVDIFNEEPLIVGEVTPVTRTIDKITIFLRKVKFLSKKFGKEPFAVIYVTYTFNPDIREEAINLLSEANVTLYELINRKLIRK